MFFFFPSQFGMKFVSIFRATEMSLVSFQCLKAIQLSLFGNTEKFNRTIRTRKQLKTSLLAQAKLKEHSEKNKKVGEVSFRWIWVRAARRWSGELFSKLARIGWRSQGEQGKNPRGAIARPGNLQQKQTLNTRVTDGPASVSKQIALGLMQKSRSKSEIFLLLGTLLHKKAKAPKCLREGARLPQDVG